VAVLGENDNAKLLAGGQSLLPILRLRLAHPDVVVDLNRATGMHGIREEGDHLGRRIHHGDRPRLPGADGRARRDGPLDAWYDRIDVAAVLTTARQRRAKDLQRQLSTAKLRHRTSLYVLPKLAGDRGRHPGPFG
jgi:hypothetical protein